MKKLFLFMIMSGVIIISGCIGYKTETIIDGIVTIDAGKYANYQFSIPYHASVTGDFAASGGSGNDIRVIILDETSYNNWINGNSVSEYYDSGQETTGKIYATLSKGNYYLIYSNTFSTVSTKNIKTKVDITYTV